MMVAVSLVLTSCSTSVPSAPAVPSSAPTSPQTLTVNVATFAEYPPFEFINEQTKEYQGFDIDIMKAIAQNQNLDVEFISVAFYPLLAGMAQGKYDAAISAIAITEDRKKKMLFSEPYFLCGQIVTVRKDNSTIKGKDTLAGNVGAQTGTAGVKEIKEVKEAILKTYDDIDAAFKDMINGQIEAIVCDNLAAQQYVKNNPENLKTVGNIFNYDTYGIAVAKDKTELLAKINAGIKAIKSEGTLDQLIYEWFEKELNLVIIRY
jgi:polar amino acid transport system substrate-binding protein